MEFKEGDIISMDKLVVDGDGVSCYMVKKFFEIKTVGKKIIVRSISTGKLSRVEKEDITLVESGKKSFEDFYDKHEYGKNL